MMSRRRLNRKYGWIWLFALCALAQQSEAQVLQPRTIHRIIITNIGPQTVSESLVRANIRLKEGDRFIPGAADDDVRNLYATGYFAPETRVGVEDTPLGVDVYYYLKPKPKLTDITFVGNKKYSARKLTKKLTDKLSEPLDERKLFLEPQEIKKLYQKSGYPQTQVRYDMHHN